MKSSCLIQTSSHKLCKSAFEFFDNPEINLGIEEVCDSSFVLSLDIPSSSDLYTDYFEFHSHITFCSYLAALNIASLGLFTWGAGLELRPVYKLHNHESEVSKLFTLSQDHLQKFDKVRDLTNEDVKKSIILFGVLCREEQSFVRSEYLKGIIHLSVNYYDMNFHREAFYNFYRCLELLVTQNILKIRKLSNELKQIQNVLLSYGIGADLLNEFRELYAMRCGQVMHSQSEQKPVTYDEAIKMKIFAEIALNKYYMAKANEIRESMA